MRHGTGWTWIQGWLLLIGVMFAMGWTVHAEEGALKTAMTDNTLSALFEDQPILCYRFGEVPFKPYAQTFFTPAGVNILRDAPHDHLHHHALMFAVGVNKVSFWAELPECGSQKHIGFDETGLSTMGGMPWAGFVERLEWRMPQQETAVVNERRAVYASRDAALNASLMFWESELSVPEGGAPATLTGDHYYGLGMRFLVSMDTGGEFFNAAGAFGDIVRGDERLSPADWCAYTAEADGKRVTVAMFDCPANPRYPALWFTMQTPFAYLSATRNLWKEPMTLTPGKPLRFRHAAAVWDGRINAETVEKMRTRLSGVWK